MQEYDLRSIASNAYRTDYVPQTWEGIAMSGYVTTNVL